MMSTSSFRVYRSNAAVTHSALTAEHFPESMRISLFKINMVVPSLKAVGFLPLALTEVRSSLPITPCRKCVTHEVP